MVKATRWVDAFVILLSLVVIGLSVWGMSTRGAFNYALYQDDKLVWHLIRSSGLVAYVLLLASTIWGLFLSSQLVRDWSPGPISMTLHSTISWLALLMGLGHGLLLMLDDYFSYTLVDVLVPFTGPYRPEYVGMGTLGFWILLTIALSFPMKKWIGHKIWKWLHYLSYAAFILVTLHGLFAGTDTGHIGFRLLVGIGVTLVVLLLGIRVGKDRTTVPQRVRRANSQ